MSFYDTICGVSHTSLPKRNVTNRLTTGWEPDTAVVDAVVEGRRTLPKLDTEDRAVVVAELSCRGESVEMIANRLECSTRVVKRVRAWPLTRTLIRAREAEGEVEEWQARALHRPGGEAERLRLQVRVLSEALEVSRRQFVVAPRRRRVKHCAGQQSLF